EAAYALTLEASPIGPLVRDFVAQEGSWKGTATALLTALETLAHGGVNTGNGTTTPPQAGTGGTVQAPKAGKDVTKQTGWPKNGRALSNALRRLAPTLRAVGVDVLFDRDPDHARSRIIRLTDTTALTRPENQTPGTASESGEREQEQL